MTCKQQLFDIQMKEKGQNFLISTFHQKAKRQHKYYCPIEESKGKKKCIKREKSLVKNSTQCNILGSYVKDLEKELDILKDQVDENSNNIQSNMFETRSNGKGKPCNAKLRSCIYFLRSRQIGVEHIVPIIENV